MQNPTALGGLIRSAKLRESCKLLERSPTTTGTLPAEAELLARRAVEVHLTVGDGESTPTNRHALRTPPAPPRLRLRGLVPG